MDKISNELLQKIINGNDIVNIVSEYVKLEKQGKNYFGLCPFHNEKTPSFSVSSEKQIFHCFSCGEGGNVINFLAKIENISYFQSLKRLSQRINLNIELNNDDNILESKYYEINKFVSDYYQFALLNTNEGKKALEYLESRNIDLETIKRFRIGLSPDSVNSLYQALKANGYSELLMLELGHVIKNNDKYYDKFKKRIMFPINDDDGNVVGFSGRIYDANKDEPKYINTMETPVFKKSNIVYNLDVAKKTIRQANRVYLFEGFMDVIAAVKSGVLESVATMGTALTSNHISLIKRYTNNIVICYDGDEAGIEATKRAIDIMVKQNVNSFVVNLKEGLDPDEYVQKYGTLSFIEFLNINQKSYKEYMYLEYIKDININNIATIEAFKRKVFYLILSSSPTERELFLSKLSSDIKVSISTLVQDFDRYKQYNENRNTISERDVKNKDYFFRLAERYRPSSKKLNDTEYSVLQMCMENRKYIKNFSNYGIPLISEDAKRMFFDLDAYYNTYDVFDEKIFLSTYILNNEKYLEYYKKVIAYNATLKTVYTEENIDQCVSVLKLEIIAGIIQGLKQAKSNTDDFSKQEEIAMKIINQLKNVKIKN